MIFALLPLCAPLIHYFTKCIDLVVSVSTNGAVLSILFPCLSGITSTFCPFRVFWKPCKCVESLPEPRARGLHWVPEDTEEPFLPALAVSMYSFPQHNGGVPCNNLLYMINMTLLIISLWYVRAVLIIASHHLYRICRYRSCLILCRISTSLLLNILAVSTDQFNTGLFILKTWKHSWLLSCWFLSIYLILFSGFPEAQVTQIMEHVEKLIMTRLHKWVFCHDSCDDEQKDLALQRRIR